MLLTGDFSKVIGQWRIEGDNLILILISQKENSYEHNVYFLLNIGDGYIASESTDNTIKIL